MEEPESTGLTTQGTGVLLVSRSTSFSVYSAQLHAGVSTRSATRRLVMSLSMAMALPR